MEGKKNVLITGVNGFIGSHLAEKFASEGYMVSGLVRQPDNISKLQGIPVRLYKGDITAPETLEEIFNSSSFEYVIHAAGLASDWGSIEHFRKVNFEGTKNVAIKAAKHKVKRFVYISSTAIHGFNHEALISEESFIDPPNNYALSKKDAENWLFEASELQNIEITAIRPGNVFGPRDTTFIDKYLDFLMKGSGGYVSGGISKTCPTYIENLSEAIYLAAIHPNAKGKSFIITDGLDITWRQFTEKLCESLDLKKPSMSIPYLIGMGLAQTMESIYLLFGIKSAPALTKYRIMNGGKNYTFSIQKAKDILGYQPKVDLEASVERTITWYKKFKGLN